MIRNATFLERISAWTVDTSIFILIWCISANVMINKYKDVEFNDMSSYFKSVSKLNYEMFFLTLFIFILYFSYVIYMEKKYSMTIGKFIFSLKVKYKSENGYVKIKDVLIRLFGCCISWIAFNVGHLYMRFDKDKITLYDKLTNIFVLYDKNIMLGASKPMNYNLSLKIQKLMVVFLIFLVIILSYVMINYYYIAIIKGFYLYYY